MANQRMYCALLCTIVFTVQWAAVSSFAYNGDKTESDQKMCRLPVNDAYRHYYINYGSSSSVACLKYGDFGSDSTVIAVACELNGIGDVQLALRPDMAQACADGINGRPGAMHQPPCNILSTELEGDSFTQRELLRLTGQATATNLDMVYVSDETLVCTESYGEATYPAPSAAAKKCSRGTLRRTGPSDLVRVDVKNSHDCSVIKLWWWKLLFGRRRR
eukprot:scpid87757/ scgid18349/ 